LAGPLIVSGDRVLGPEQLRENALRAANGFKNLGMGSEESIAVLLRNDFAFFELMEAARLSGSCFVPVNWHFTAHEIGYIIRDANVRVLVVHADMLAQAKEAAGPATTILVVPVPPEMALSYGIAPQQCAVCEPSTDWNPWMQSFAPLDESLAENGTLMLYTSGTTGNPKGVRRDRQSSDEAAAYLDSIIEAFALRSGARTVTTGPLYHAGPLGYARASLKVDAYIRLMPRFDAQALLEIIGEERITHSHLVPIMFIRLLRLDAQVRAGYDTSTLECIIHGAAPCPDEIKRRMIDWLGPVIREYYGSTEASIGCIVDSEDWLLHPGTVGKPLPGVELKVYDEDGHALGANEVGEIHYRQKLAPDFDYYHRSAERASIERDRLLSNGDLGYIDDDGFVYLRDRKRDMIISGGVNIYPAEIEAAILSHTDVDDCAVFGIPDDEFGEAVLAAVQRRAGSGLTQDALIKHIEPRLARFKLPRNIEFHNALPRFDNGKVYKQKLKDLRQQ